jgi:hypothetical protein
MRFIDSKVVHLLRISDKDNRLDCTELAIQTVDQLANFEFPGVDPLTLTCIEGMLWCGLDQLAVDGQMNDDWVFVRDRVRDFVFACYTGGLVVGDDHIADFKFTDRHITIRCNDGRIFTETVIVTLRWVDEIGFSIGTGVRRCGIIDGAGVDTRLDVGADIEIVMEARTVAQAIVEIDDADFYLI